MSTRDRESPSIATEEEAARAQRGGPSTTPAERRYGSPLAQALADKGVTSPTAGDAAQVAVDGKGAGAPVDSGVRSQVEPHVGTSLGGVKVHADPLSQQATAAMGARAFAHGPDVFLGPGESGGDLALMAHELTHVVQQGAAAEPGAQRLAVGAANSPAEAEADRVAGAVTGGAAPAQLLVDDGSTPAAGQMTRTQFLTQLRPAVIAAADQELGPIWSVVGCPYIESYFNHYGRSPAGHIEQVIRRFAPAARNARTAAEYIAPVIEQVRIGVRSWRATGRIVGPAAEVAPPGVGQSSAPAALPKHGDAPPAVQARPEPMAPTEPVEPGSPAAALQRLGPGELLAGSVAGRMGPALGHDLSGVRVHTGPEAAQLARDENARAVTVGQHVAFASGEYQPGTLRGDALLAHELAHTVQQRGASSGEAQAQRAEASAPSSGHEEDADRAAGGVLARLYGGVRGAFGRLAERSEPALSSGFSLRRCGPAPDPIPGQMDPGAPFPQTDQSPDLAPDRDLGPQPYTPPPAPTDTVPVPVLWDVVGDRFLVVFEMDANGYLLVSATYQGPHQAEPGTRVTMRVRFRRRGGGDRPLVNAVLDRIGHDRLVLDAFGDGGWVLVVRDEATPDPASFDRRLHNFTLTANNQQADHGQVAVVLAPGEQTRPVVGGPGDATVSQARLTLNHDEFQLRARRFGESNSVQLRIEATGAESNSGADQLVPLAHDLRAVRLRVMRNAGRDIELDVDGDGRADVKIVHTVLAETDQASGQQRRTHFLRTFDADGVLLATHQSVVAGREPVDIPEDQDESRSRPDTEVWTRGRPPEQADIPGEDTRTVTRPGGRFELRVDGDGDRGKELVLLLRLESSQPSTGPRSLPVGRVRFDITQISSGTSRGGVVEVPLTALDPSVTQAADGSNPLEVTLGRMDAYGGISGGTPVKLRLFRPTEDAQQRTYRMTVFNPGADWEGNIVFPRETTETTPLIQPEEVPEGHAPPGTERLGNIFFRELRLGDYGDLFRFTVEKPTATTAVLGISGVNAGGGVAAAGIQLLRAAEIRAMNVLTSDPLSVGLDLTGGGTAGAVIHDRITQDVGTSGPPAAVRMHWMTVTGPNISSGREVARFWVSENRFTGGGSLIGDNRAAGGAALAVGSMAAQQAQGTPRQVLDRLTVAIGTARQRAADTGRIPADMFAAFRTLEDSFTQLGALENPTQPLTEEQRQRKEQLQARAANCAEILLNRLSELTFDQDERVGRPEGGWVLRNRYTDAERSNRLSDDHEYFSHTGTLGLPNAIRSGNWTEATDMFRRLTDGFTRWVATQAPEAEGSALTYNLSVANELRQIQSRGDSTDAGRLRRVHGVFLPNDRQITADSPLSSLPLQMYLWRDSDQVWHLRDITNPGNIVEETEGGGTEHHPPDALFRKLNWRDHFSDGIIRFQCPRARDQQGNAVGPEGPAGQVVVDDSALNFWDVLRAIGLVAAAVGLIATGVGAPTVALYAFAIGAAATVVDTIHHMIEQGEHNRLDAGTVFLDVAIILTSLVQFGAATSRIIVNAARAASVAESMGQGVAWSGRAALWAQAADKAYIPLVQASFAGNALTLVALSADCIARLDAIERGGGSESDKTAAKSAILIQFMISGGLTAIALRGDAAAFRGGGRPNIVIDFVDGVPVAHAGGVRFGGGDIGVPHVGPPRPGASAGELAEQAQASAAARDTHARARWQSHGIEEVAAGQTVTGETPITARAPAEAAQANAADMMADPEFLTWYRRWIAQAEPVTMEGNRMRVRYQGPAGEPPMPDHIRDIIQARIVDNPRAGFSLYQRAFDQADQLRAIQARIQAEGGHLDLDPTHPSWRANRGRLVAELPGGEAAVARYEAARMGVAGGDLQAYAAEQARLAQMVPDTELERVRALFRDYEVYATGNAVQPEKPIGRLEDLDVVVVVPDGTPPDQMAAVEARARGFRLRPDPAYLRQQRITDPNATIPIDAKVMTPDQFAGFASLPTAPGRTPAHYHNLNRTNAELFASLPLADRAVVARAMAAAERGAAVTTVDGAHMRRMIASGRLQPERLPQAVRDQIPAHTGADVHNHLLGVPDTDYFIHTAGGGTDTQAGSARRALDVLHGRFAGNAAVQEEAPAAWRVLREGRAEVDRLAASGADQTRVEAEAHRTMERALVAGEVPFDQTYTARDELIKASPGGYRQFTRDAMEALARQGVGYSEQSVSTNKLNRSLPGGMTGELADDLRRIEGLETDMRFLGMANTGHFSAEPSAQGRRDFDQLKNDLSRLLRERADMMGVDIAGPEAAVFTAEGMRRFQEMYQVVSAAARVRGRPLVLRPHVGEGYAPHGGTGGDHVEVARRNLESMITTLEGMGYSPSRSQRDMVIIRFGHATHATAEQIARMSRLGVIVEANIGSNLATGSIADASEHPLLYYLYHETPLMLSTDAQGVMGYTLADEYDRAGRMIQQYRDNRLAIEINGETVWFNPPPPGTAGRGMTEIERARMSMESMQRSAARYVDGVHAGDATDRLRR